MSTSVDPNSYRSRHREKVVEHLLVGELLRELWCRECPNVDVLKPEVDAAGYDVVFSFRRITRHVQIKASVIGGAAASQQVSRDLALHQSGCIIWAVVDPSLRFQYFYWFGAPPGEPLPDLGALKPARQARANAQGVKAFRLNTRVIPKARFEKVSDIAGLVTKLFGTLELAGSREHSA
jgi:hypothetical protein